MTRNTVVGPPNKIREPREPCYSFEMNHPENNQRNNKKLMQTHHKIKQYLCNYKD